MRRFPHSIDKDILAVYQRPSWLPPSDDEYGEDSEESEEVEEEVGEEGEEEDGSEVVEEEEEEEECVEEEEDTICFEEKDEIYCHTRKKEYKESEASGKLGKTDGEKTQGKQKRSKSKEDHESASAEEVKHEKIETKIIKKKKERPDESSEEEEEYMAALREKRLIGESEEDEEVEEEEFLWEVDDRVPAGKRLTLKPREYDAYDEDSDEMIDAGDDDWIEGQIPTLADLAIRTMATNFEIFEDTDLRSLMTLEDWNYLIDDEVPLDLPLILSVPMIPESYYWEKACRHKYQKETCYDHGNSWKRMFLELTCQQYIENLVPSTALRREISNLTELLEPHVLKLVIDQMAVEQIQLEDGTLKWTHIDLGIIVPQLTKLQEIHVTYGAKNCGLEFEWYKFEVSEEDIRLLGESITDLTELRVFKLHRCIVTDSMCVSLWGKLGYLMSLRELYFVHCCLGDETAIALAALIMKLPNVDILDLKNNEIGVRGAKALAKSLSVSCVLDHLNLSLNAIQDEGGQSIATALESNVYLTQLHLGGCSLGPATFLTFAKCLEVNSTLLDLNLSNNEVTEDAFETLMLSLESNKVIQDLDVSMTGVDAESLTMLRKRLDKNKGMNPHETRIINPRFVDEARRRFSNEDIEDHIADMS